MRTSRGLITPKVFEFSQQLRLAPKIPVVLVAHPNPAGFHLFRNQRGHILTSFRTIALVQYTLLTRMDKYSPGQPLSGLRMLIFILLSKRLHEFHPGEGTESMSVVKLLQIFL